MTPSSRRRGRGFLLLCAGLLLPAWQACGGASTQEIETVDRVPVATRVVVRGTIRPLVVATGTVRPAPGAELVVTAPQAARIVEMPWGVGDTAPKGALLVRFDIPSLAVDAGDRRAALASSVARLTNARAAEERIRGLFERGVAARKELEDAERELAEAEASLAAARTARTATGELAARAVVRAPWTGVVAARGHNPGELVDASTTEPILRLVDPNRLQVEAAIPLADLAEVRLGSTAAFFGPGSSPSAAATVISRPAAVDPATATATVRLAFAASDRFPTGTPVRLEIQGPPHAGVLLVPAVALVQEGTESFVFTVDAGGTAHRHPVRVGIVAGGQAEVISGVTAGAAVVVSGQNALPDGAATTPTPAEGRLPAQDRQP